MNLDVFTHRLTELYQPPAGEFTLIDVPEMKYLMIDGTGDPAGPAFQAAVKWLFSLAHFIKPPIRKKLGKRFVEPPLECLFWAKDGANFSALGRDEWNWRVMIVVLDLVTDDLFQDGVARVTAKLGPAPTSLKLGTYTEGQCVQTMYVGDSSGVKAVCQAMYDDFLPARGLQPNGMYHEIYLNDPARIAPENRRIVIRQPVAYF